MGTYAPNFCGVICNGVVLSFYSHLVPYRRRRSLPPNASSRRRKQLSAEDHLIPFCIAPSMHSFAVTSPRRHQPPRLRYTLASAAASRTRHFRQNRARLPPKSCFLSPPPSHSSAEGEPHRRLPASKRYPVHPSQRGQTNRYRMHRARFRAVEPRETSPLDESATRACQTSTRLPHSSSCRRHATSAQPTAAVRPCLPNLAVAGRRRQIRPLSTSLQLTPSNPPPARDGCAAVVCQPSACRLESSWKAPFASCLIGPSARCRRRRRLSCAEVASIAREGARYEPGLPSGRLERLKKRARPGSAFLTSPTASRSRPIAALQLRQ